MSTEVIAVIAGLVGAMIGAFTDWMVSRTKTSGNERTAFRDSILKRIRTLETKQDDLEQDVMIWKGRYWSLYTWLVNFCLSNGISAKPPSFHEMEADDLKGSFPKNPDHKNK